MLLKKSKKLKKELCLQENQAATFVNKLNSLEILATNLTRKIDEQKRIADETKENLASKNESCKKLEAKIIVLKRKLERYDKIRLEDILSTQRKDNNISGIGFEIGQILNSNNKNILYESFGSQEKKEDNSKSLTSHENVSKSASTKL